MIHDNKDRSGQPSCAAPCAFAHTNAQTSFSSSVSFDHCALKEEKSHAVAGDIRSDQAASLYPPSLVRIFLASVIAQLARADLDCQIGNPVRVIAVM
jgi:hypothetical protein